MKKLIALAFGLSLAGCATAPVPSIIHRPVAHVAPVVAPAPTVTVVPAAPVPPATFKMRWSDRVGALRSHVHFFHQKKTAQ